MFGDFPPSSSEMRLMSREANSMMRRPTLVEPVKETLRMSGCVLSASPTAPPGPGKTWSTPGGKPAEWPISPSATAVSGEIDAGFNTTQFPAANAGAAFQQAMGNGKFQGTMQATTPIDWRKVKPNPPLPTGIV